jgi:hypothetical protein
MAIMAPCPMYGTGGCAATGTGSKLGTQSEGRNHLGRTQRGHPRDGIFEVQSARWNLRGAIREMESSRCNPRDGIFEVQSARWNLRDAIREMESSRCNPRDGIFEVQSARWNLRDAISPASPRRTTRPHGLTHVSRGSREKTPSLMTVSAWRSGARKASCHLMREAIRGALSGNQKSSVARRRREEGD